jgi:hypothetical protein
MFERATILADAGFCNEQNAKYLAENGLEGYIADPQLFQPKEFQLAKDHSHCICPR